jgi:hypothetical protein
MTEGNKFDAKEYTSLLSDIYKEAESFKFKPKPPKLQPLSKSPSTTQNMLMPKSLYKKLDNVGRRVMIDLASLSPDALSFITHSKNIDLSKTRENPNSKGLKLIPEGKIQASSASKGLKTGNFATDPSPRPVKTKTNAKEPSPLRHKYLFNQEDLRKAMKNMRNQDSESTISKKRSQKDLCSVIRTLEQQCDLSNDLNSSGEIESQLRSSRKVLKNWTERLNWTASKIEQLSRFDDSVKKELYNHDLYTKCVEKIEAISLQKDLESKSLKSLRSQAKLLKKVLIRKKLKIL